jgi:hypothetical protein
MRRLSFVFALAIFAVSCYHKTEIPKDVLSTEKMKSVLWDIVSAGQYLTGYVLPKDTTDKIAATEKIYAQVFQVNHITREEFDRSFTFYKQHPEYMVPLLDSLNKRETYSLGRLQHRNDSMQKKTPALPQ